jgi:hypothetical protein
MIILADIGKNRAIIGLVDRECREINNKVTASAYPDPLSIAFCL